MSSHPHCAGNSVAFDDCPYAAEWESIGHCIVGERCSVKDTNPFIRSDPEKTARVLAKGEDNIGRKAISHGVCTKGESLRVQSRGKNNRNAYEDRDNYGRFHVMKYIRTGCPSEESTRT